MGMSWDGELYIDIALPFWLHLAPKIFNAVANEVEWIIQQHGVDPEGVAGGSMKTYLAAIRYLQIVLGLGDPQMAH